MKLMTFGVWAIGVLLPLAAAAGLEQGLVLHLPLTQDLKDHSPAANPIEVVGKVRIDTNGAVFGGRRDWLEAPHIPLNQRPFAIALWVKDSTSEPTVGLLEQFDLNLPRRHFSLMLRNNRNPYFGFYTKDLFASYQVSRSNEWVHLVFQYDGKKQQIWVNGRWMCSRTAPAYEGVHGVTTIGKMPRWSNVSGQDFVGHLRDFRIYHRELNHLEIGELAGINPPTENEKSPTAVAANVPALSPRTIQEREALAKVMSPDPSLPFLEINEQQVIINGRAGQIYTLQSTADFNNWKALARMTNQTGRLVYEDKARQITPMQFFRVKVEGFEP